GELSARTSRIGAQPRRKTSLRGLLRRNRLGAKRPRLLVLLDGRRSRGLVLLLAGILPLLTLEGAQFTPLGAAQPAFRLQFLQAIRRARRGARRLVLLRVLPLGALQRAQLAPLGAV